MQTMIDDLSKNKEDLSQAMAQQKKQLVVMQKQISSAQQYSKSENTEDSIQSPQSATNSQSDKDKTLVRFCHRCGKTGRHVAAQCRGDPNPELVQKKCAERKAHLNFKGFH